MESHHKRIRDGRRVREKKKNLWKRKDVEKIASNK